MNIDADAFASDDSTRTHKCVLLFAHHKNDAVTRAHYERLRTLNPYPIVALRNQSDDGLEGSVRPLYEEDPWHGTDGLLYAWFKQRPFNAERYVFIEWDCLMTVPVNEHFAEVWDADAASSEVIDQAAHPFWWWFREISRLPSALRQFATGLVPLNGTILSHAAMEALANANIPSNVFSELRLGTLLRAMGFRLEGLPSHKARTNSVKPYLTSYKEGQQGLFHPIKNLHHTMTLASDVIQSPRNLPAMIDLALLDVTTRPGLEGFSADDAIECLSRRGFSNREGSRLLFFLRDNGILTETERVAVGPRFRFRLPEVADRLASSQTTV